MNDPTPDDSSEDLKFCIKSDDKIEDENEEEENVHVGVIASAIKSSFERAAQQQRQKLSANANTPQSDQTKDKSSDSEEKEFKKTKSKQGRHKIEIDDNGQPYNTGRWSEEEHRKFMEGIEIYGKDWKKVQLHVGTRSSAQSRSHAQKVLAKSLTTKSPSNQYFCRKECDFEDEKEECSSSEEKQDNKANEFKEINKIKTPIPSPK